MKDYEIKMTINRFREPNLELQINLDDIEDTEQTSVELFVQNTGRISATSAHFRVFIHEDFFSNCQGWYIDKNISMYEDIPVVVLSCNIGNSEDNPAYRYEFYPGMKIPISSKLDFNTIALDLRKIPYRQRSQCEIPIFIEVYTSNMRSKKKKVLFKIDRINRYHKVSEEDY